MKKLLNTLYVTTPDMSLKQEGETIVAEKDNHIVMRLPIHTLSGIVVLGYSYVSPYLLALCAERGVCVSFFSLSGKFLSRVEGPVTGNVRLRIAQFRAYEDKTLKANIARSFLIGKLINTRSVLLRRLRDHGEDTAVAAASEKLKETLILLRDSPADVERLRGLEGSAASTYFSVFNNLMTAQQDAFYMLDRNRRPPRDPMNALLSFLYNLLAHDCRGALEGVGLDPQIGFLHEIRPGRPSLALDLMEEFRAILADRLALSIVNLRQVNGRDFKTSESGAVMMSDNARKTVLSAWQKRKQEEVVHPFLNEKIQLGLAPHCQALLLARFLRGDLDAYPPYIVQK